MSFENEPPNITLNNKEKSTNEFGKQILPPILRKKDRKLIEEIRTFIDDEKEKTKCNKDEYDEKRFSIYRLQFKILLIVGKFCSFYEIF